MKTPRDNKTKLIGMTDDRMFQTARSIARDLVQRDCDPNEVQKAFVYLRTHKDGERFFSFLNTLVKHGRFLVRSGRTLNYYKAILEVCQRHLNDYRSNVEAMQQVLGWGARLMRFYMAKQIGTSPSTQTPGRQSGRPQRRKR